MDWSFLVLLNLIRGKLSFLIRVHRGKIEINTDFKFSLIEFLLFFRTFNC